ncbi:tail fiber protein [Nibrella saemangeumensis]|uniref:Tail fiber protein n=1 Tax=Nibrella saemangeumensis TaxID=1084526 RepID=A0ABP8MRG0_9BACT
MEAFIASIILFGGTYAPRGWAFCQGQILSIAQNTALFALLGTTYGGNGQTTFALPDLRGRVPIHPGQGPGLSPYSLGQMGGFETTTLLTANLPAHTHTLKAFSENGDKASPQSNFLAATGGLDPEYRTTGSEIPMAAGAIGMTGGNQPFNNIQPYLALNYIICLQGIFPSRN